MSEDVIVMKFGGTSLASPARMRRAARRVRLHARRRGVVVVVSAPGRTTDRMLHWIERAAGQGARHARELDRALTTGEDFAAAALAATLTSLGTAAVSLRGGEAGLRGRGRFGRADIDCVDPKVLRRELRSGRTPVVSGFQAVRADGETVTLGRGGSDLTAAVLAGELGARECHLVTDVPYVFDKDPALHADAVPWFALTHEQLCALAERGGCDGRTVVERRAARVAAERNLLVRVYDFRAPLREPGGTVIGGMVPVGRVA